MKPMTVPFLISLACIYLAWMLSSLWPLLLFAIGALGKWAANRWSRMMDRRISSDFPEHR